MRIAAHLIVVLAAATTALGCGSQQQANAPPASAPPVMDCQAGGRAPAALTNSERQASIAAGPLTLVYARQQAEQPATTFDPARQSLRRLIDDPSTGKRERQLARRTFAHTRPGSYGVAPMRIRVSAGRQATVTVPTEHRESVSLIYTARARNQENPGAAGIYRVHDGDPAVTFRACENSDTEFLGGIVVASARCVPLRIAEPGRPPRRQLLSFGAGECGSETTEYFGNGAYRITVCNSAGSFEVSQVAAPVQDPDGGETLVPIERAEPTFRRSVTYGDQPNTPFDSRPRIDLLPPRGAVLWMVLGNGEGERISDKEHRELFKFRPKGEGPKEGVTAFHDGDSASSRWENTRTWIKVSALGGSKYCQFFAYAGDSPRAPFGALQEAMRTVRFAY